MIQPKWPKILRNLLLSFWMINSCQAARQGEDLFCGRFRERTGYGSARPRALLGRARRRWDLAAGHWQSGGHEAAWIVLSQTGRPISEIFLGVKNSFLKVYFADDFSCLNICHPFFPKSCWVVSTGGLYGEDMLELQHFLTVAMEFEPPGEHGSCLVAVTCWRAENVQVAFGGTSRGTSMHLGGAVWFMYLFSFFLYWFIHLFTVSICLFSNFLCFFSAFFRYLKNRQPCQERVSLWPRLPNLRLATLGQSLQSHRMSVAPPWWPAHSVAQRLAQEICDRLVVWSRINEPWKSRHFDQWQTYGSKIQEKQLGVNFRPKLGPKRSLLGGFYLRRACASLAALPLVASAAPATTATFATHRVTELRSEGRARRRETNRTVNNNGKQQAEASRNNNTFCGNTQKTMETMQNIVLWEKHRNHWKTHDAFHAGWPSMDSPGAHEASSKVHALPRGWSETTAGQTYDQCVLVEIA